MFEWTIKVPKSRQARIEADRRASGIFVADSPAKCEQALRMISREHRVYGVDTESEVVDSEMHPKGIVRVFSVQFSTAKGPKIFVPNYGPHEGQLRIFKRWLESELFKKTLHNAKWDMHVFGNHGIRMRGLKSDTMVMDFLKDTGEMFHGLKECIRRYFGEETVEYRDTFKVPKLLKNGGAGKGFIIPPLSTVLKHVFYKDESGNPHCYRCGVSANAAAGGVDDCAKGYELLLRYATSDPYYGARLDEYLTDHLEGVPWVGDKSYYEYYKEFELPYTEVLYELERVGCLMDMDHLGEMEERLKADILKSEQEFLRLAVKAGADILSLQNFNMNSGQQIGKLFEQQLGITIGDRTPTGKPKTDDAALSAIKGRGRKVAEVLLEHRKLTKFLGTYVGKFKEMAPRYKGRIHTTLKQIGTATGRLSSAGPNLQNIPASDKDDYGIRKAFVAPKGMVVGDIDLSNIELRLMAHFSQDKAMLEALRKGWNLHSLTAVGTFDGPRAFKGAQSITKELLDEVKHKFESDYKAAKVLNFGIGYGMGPMKFASMTGKNERAGYEAIENFYRTYPGLKRGIQSAQFHARKYGYVRTLLMRYAHIEGINSPHMGLRKAGERRAWNYKIQGSAADLLKMGMILVHRNERLRELGVRMNLQIHDELLFEVPKGAEKESKKIIDELISHPYRSFGFKDLLLDTPGELDFGKSWAEAKK